MFRDSFFFFSALSVCQNDVPLKIRLLIRHHDKEVGTSSDVYLCHLEKKQNDMDQCYQCDINDREKVQEEQGFDCFSLEQLTGFNFPKHNSDKTKKRIYIIEKVIEVSFVVLSVLLM